MLRRGSKGPDVGVAQRALAKLGYYSGAIDNDFGPAMEAAVVKWEQERYTDAEVSEDELDFFRRFESQDDLPVIPRGQDELVKRFGAPWMDGSLDGSSWWKLHQEKVTVPSIFTFNASDSMYVNAYIAVVVKKTFADIAARGLAQEVKTFDGCFKLRAVRGYENTVPRKWSVHTWGMAIDINAAENGLGIEPKLSPELVSCFKRFGWQWGGDFKRKDGMHFQFAVGL